MASWLKWTVGVTATCVALAWLILTSDREPSIDPAQYRAWQARETLNGAHRTLIEWAAMDTALKLLPDSPGVRIVDARMPAASRAPDIRGARPDSSARWAMDTLRTELAEHASEMRIAVVALPATHGAHENADEDMRFPGGIYYFAGSDERGPYCAIALGFYGLTAPGSLLGQLRRADPLGPCRLWLRYGEPGAGIASWLPRAGHLMVQRSPVERDPPPTRREIFGFRRFDANITSVDLAGQACLAGRRDACLDALLDARQWERSFFDHGPQGPAIFRFSTFSWSRSDDIQSFFAELERELGADAFARVWTSDAPPEVTLEAALGADLSGWVMDWARARFGAEPRGPTLPWTTLLLSLLTIGLLAAAAVAVAQRRQIA